MHLLLHFDVRLYAQSMLNISDPQILKEWKFSDILKKLKKSLPKNTAYVFPNLHENICFVCFPELRLVYVAIKLISTSVSCFQQGLNLHYVCFAIFVPLHELEANRSVGGYEEM